MEAIGLEDLLLLMKNRTGYKRKKEQTKECRNNVHKYKTYFQAERIIYTIGLGSTSIFKVILFLYCPMSLS